MNLNIAVIQNDTFFYNQLSAFIKNWAERNKTSVQCKSYPGREAYQSFVHNSIAFDAVFMDILPQNENGLEWVYRLREYNTSLHIVFAASTEDYLREGYEVQAIGYMVKPFEQIKVDQYMNRILHLSAQSYCRDFSFDCDGIVRVIPLNSIRYFKWSEHYIHVHCADEVYQFREKLNVLQQRLPSEFLRCNRNTIINLNYLFSFTSQKIRLTEGTSFSVSHNHQKNAKIKCFQQLTS